MYINYTCIDGHLCLLPIINIWHNKKYSILFYSNYFLWYFNIFLFMLVRETFLFPSVTRCVPYLCRHCHLFNGNVYLWFIMISFYALCHNILEMFTVFHLVYQEWDKYHCYSYDCFHDLCSIIMILIFIMLIEHVHVYIH